MLSVLPPADGRGGKTGEGGGYDYFTTTLSISPLKNAQKINEIGEELAEIYKVPHLTSDFKKRMATSVLLSCLMSMLCTGRITAAVYFQRKKPWTENGWLLRTE